MPKRIQRKRTKGWRMPPNTIYVGRSTPLAHCYGNPFKEGEPLTKDMQRWVKQAARKWGIKIGEPLTKHQAVLMHREYLQENEGTMIGDLIKQELRGKNLACWCALNEPCHADNLLEFVNA